MKQGETCNAGSVLLSFFVGGLVGAGLALLLAPRSGQETREQIKGVAEDIKGKAEGYIEEVKGRAEGYMEEVKSKATTIIEKGKELLEEKKSMVESAVEAGKQAYRRESGKKEGEPA